jgi:hypothetical protein
VVDVAKAQAMTNADRTNPMVRIRPGVVQRNHQRGCAGVAGDRDARGSVDGCANSTVTCGGPQLSGYFLQFCHCIKEV